MKKNIAQLSELYSSVLTQLGENPKREGLLKTPERVAKALTFLTEGYHKDPAAIINAAKFKEEHIAGNMVCVNNIEFFSLCEHHLLPFWGEVHIAYIPNEHIVGLSKIPRIVNAFARRLQVQERLTKDLMEALKAHLAPGGVGVVVKARHMCMMMRGVEKNESITVTSAYCGKLKEDFYKKDFLNSWR